MGAIQFELLNTYDPLNGVVEEIDEYGRLLKRENYKEGKLNGMSEEFYVDGRVSGRENYKNGELDGVREMFYENGQLALRQNYKDGKKTYDSGWLDDEN